ncbi:MAG: PepSY domain-containing protein [Verrucomicrobiales bacterium]|nr:PepSY domain-containing protein [Verrucomicrobiales bacterium]
MKTFRRALFWLHMVIGLLTGGVIAITVFTGACLAFEKQVLAWAEREVRRVTPPDSSVAGWDLDQLVAKARELASGAAWTGITVRSDPAAAVTLTFGRTQTIHANPYTGELRVQSPTVLRAFFQCMLRWHRWLGVPQPESGAEGPSARINDAIATQSGGSGAHRSSAQGGTNGMHNAEEPRRHGPVGARAIASTVVGVSACLFTLLCLSGIYLWWPRHWRWTSLRIGVLPNFRLRGKPRDWNWHNAVGIWSAPILMVLSLTGVVMAFRPVGNVIYGAPIGGPEAGLNSTHSPSFAAPEPGMLPLGPDRLFAIARREVPHWEEITLRAGGRQRGPRGARFGGEAGFRREDGPRSTAAAREGMAQARTGVGAPSQREAVEAGETRSGDGQGRGGPGGHGTPPVSVMVRETGRWSVQPIQLQVHAYTGEVLRRSTFSTQVSEVGWRRALRGLNRPLHTGEAGGWVGQCLAFAACLGGLVLVYTGFALSWRRFLGKRRGPATSTSVPARESNSMPIETAASSLPTRLPE